MTGLAIPLALLAAFQVGTPDSGIAGHWLSVGRPCTIDLTIAQSASSVDGHGVACVGPRGIRIHASGTWTPPSLTMQLEGDGVTPSPYAGRLAAPDTIRGILGEADSLVLVRVPEYFEARVERRPSLIRENCTMPEYPEALREERITGRVVLQFIIDTTGNVERSSLRVLSSDHPLFEAPARAAVLTCRYRPGMIEGRKIRVRVSQPINFTWDPFPARRPNRSPEPSPR